MKTEYIGTIMQMRAVEDTIRMSKKYTKGVFSRAAHHPVQGEDFPSRVLTEYYEVYPDMDNELSLSMSLIDAAFWLAGDTPHIDVRFRYNYQQDKGIVIIYGDKSIIQMLNDGIPGFEDAIKAIEYVKDRNIESEAQPMVGNTDRNRDSLIANS